jgi:hypothetical protein
MDIQKWGDAEMRRCGDAKLRKGGTSQTGSSRAAFVKRCKANDAEAIKVAAKRDI